jgi:very-short-patch-repair endonuclease
MAGIDDCLRPLAAANYGLITRAWVLEAGGNDQLISRRLDRRRWTEEHAGVYNLGPVPLDWKGRLRAATLAAGPTAMASHRSAAVLLGLDGIASAPIEITVPYGRRPQPGGVVVHRTRRAIEPLIVDAIPVTPPERAVLDIAWSHPSSIVEQVFESAIRRHLTTASRVADLVAQQGGWGVRGTGKVLRILDARRPGPATGSPAETMLLRRMRLAGIDEPVCQHVVHLPDGSVAVIDFAWPRRLKGVEVDGLEAHAAAQRLEDDLKRQNLLFEVQWQLRRFSGRQVARHPDEVVDSIRRFLAA